MTALLRRLERKFTRKAPTTPAKTEVKQVKQNSCRDLTREQSFWDNAVLS